MKKTTILLFIASILVIIMLIGTCQQPSSSSGGGGGEGKKESKLQNVWTWVSGDNTINQTGVYGTKGTADPSIKYEAVTVPPIKNFDMGYDGVAVPVHTVPLISSFEMGKYEVTYEQWYTVKQWAIANGYTFANQGREGTSGIIDAAPTEAKYEPVTGINWRDCIVWCNALTEYDYYVNKTKIKCVYYIDAGFITPLRTATGNNTIDRTPGSNDNPYVNWSANGYRLPTEAEWEAAARYQYNIWEPDWTPGTFASGARADYTDETATGLVAWYIVNSDHDIKAVGTKNPNHLGIYDMSGNVYEWCWDWYDDYTTSSPYTDIDPKGPETSSRRRFRADRGGSYGANSSYLRVSYRDFDSPWWSGGGYSLISFRAARNK